MKSIMKQYKELLAQSTIDVDGGDHKTRASRAMLRNQALESIERAKADYAKALNDRAFVLVVVGAESKKFAELAAKTEAVVVDCNDFYGPIADRVLETLGNRGVFGMAQFNVMASELRMWSASHKVKNYQMPSQAAIDKPMSSKEEALSLVRASIEETNGTDLVKIELESKALIYALEQESDNKVIPVVVLNGSSAMTNALFRNKGLLIQAESEVTTQTVEKAYSQIKAALKENK